VTAAANGRFDLSAASAAAAAESPPVPFLFSYKDVNYTIPPATEWPLSLQAQIAAGDLEGALTGLLGEEPYKRLLTDGMTVGELNILFTKIGEASGVENLPNLPVPAQPGSTPT